MRVALSNHIFKKNCIHAPNTFSSAVHIYTVHAAMSFSQTEKYTQIHAHVHLYTYNANVFAVFGQNTLSWKQEAAQSCYNNSAVNINLRLIDAKHMCSYIEKAHE